MKKAEIQAQYKYPVLHFKRILVDQNSTFLAVLAARLVLKISAILVKYPTDFLGYFSYFMGRINRKNLFGHCSIHTKHVSSEKSVSFYFKLYFFGSK